MKAQKEFLRKHFEKNEYNIRYTISTSTNESTKRQLGLSLDEMLINCRFSGRPCNSSDFSWFFSFQYINCFEFVPSREIYNYGRRQGLSIDLSAMPRNEDYFETNPSMGFQLMVFNKSENRRLNSYFGQYLIRANGETDVSIERSFVNKMPRPYSECTLEDSR